MKFVNPLANAATVESTSKATEDVESTSSTLDIDDSGACPKCKKQMGTAIIKSGETALYCKSCRVTMPIKVD